MKSIQRFLLILIFSVCGHWALAQKPVTISGVVVDSISLVGLPNVNIHVKHSNIRTVTDQKGSFHITAPVLDTLVFSIVGYESFEYPIYFQEEDILIRLGESFVLLPEIVTKGTRINEVPYGERREVKAIYLAEGIMSPFTYFSKTEKEKRKLVKVQQENARVRTYVEVVNDPDFKKEMMAEFSLSETQYHALLANFNKENRIVQYLTNEMAIREKISAYFKNETGKN